MLTKISDIEKRLSGRKKKAMLVAAAVSDENIIQAIMKARDKDIINATLIGNEEKIREYCQDNNLDQKGIHFINEEDGHKAGFKTVQLVHEEKADIIMNGQETYRGASFIGRAVIDKTYGISKGNRISHLALCEIEGYHKLIGITDIVMNNMPSLKEKALIISNAVSFLRVLGIEKPKVAALAAVEVVNEAMPATLEAAMLSKMSQRGQIKNCIIEGPLAFDNAISKEQATCKGIINDVSGDPDILFAPDIETAGMLYQAFVFFAKAKAASLAIGANVPIVLTTKMDSPETRVNSILLGASLYV